MRDRPILFSGPMVRALLAGTKTQTRRAMKPQPLGEIDNLGDGETIISLDGMQGNAWRCPYGVPGVRLWVRETFRLRADQDDVPPSQDWWKMGVMWYEADGPGQPSGCGGGSGKLRPSIFMPRWASRITLEITDVRVERVQEISEGDAVAEGLRAQAGDGGGAGPGYKWSGVGYEGARPGHFHIPGDRRCGCHIGGPSPAQCAYRELWDTVRSGERLKRGEGWASNPWVWAITFKVIA